MISGAYIALRKNKYPLKIVSYNQFRALAGNSGIMAAFLYSVLIHRFPLGDKAWQLWLIGNR